MGDSLDARLYTVDQVAEHLQCTRQHVYKLINTGQLTTIKLGRLRRVRPEDLSAMIAAHAVGAANADRIDVITSGERSDDA